RAVEGTGLENRRPERVPEFESLRFRQIKQGVSNKLAPLFLRRRIKKEYPRRIRPTSKLHKKSF
ncbi:hypothetical protein ACE4Z6_25190, partial [Salmonella enterica]|uniref:hypothetical protein n=1 Tax=Salmonella enterica TaxID=28901 RepID=UPI003D27C580